MRDHHRPDAGTDRDLSARPRSHCRVRGQVALILLGLTIFGAAGCGDSATLTELEAESFSPISVTGAFPAEGEQGQTLTVRISGSGFSGGVVATWERDGTPDPRITVQQTVLVSTTELDVTISIAFDADVADYDIAVSRDRKKGIGSEEDRDVAPNAFVVNEYTPHPLGFLPRSIGELNTTDVFDSNDHGVLVGRDGCCAFRWSESEGLVRFIGEGSAAHGINNKGWVIGRRGSSEESWGNAFVFREGVITDLDTLNYRDASVSAINDAGTIVGQRLGRPVAWNRNVDGGYGAPVELPLPDGDWLGELSTGRATSINDRGDIVGGLIYETATGWRHLAVVWPARGGGGHADPIVLGTWGGIAFAQAINDEGWIVGQAGLFPVAVVWHPADYTTAISLGSQTSSGAYAYDINNAGQVVGVRRGHEFKPYDGFPGGTAQATLWQLDEAGKTTEVIPLLPGSGYSDSHAKAINAQGWIFGYSEVVAWNGWVTEATLWRPDQ